jgi:TonB-dependent starch-binding outer membrane protein SusC
MMHRNRHVGPILAFLSFLAVPLAAQNGSIRGQVVDSVTQQGLAGVTVQIVGMPRQTATGADGNFTLSDVAPGAVTLKVTRIGFGPQQKSVTVTAGGSAEAKFALAPQASLLEAVVVTGYGTQRREAITGSVSTVDAATANVGVKTNVDQLLQGRAAGVDITQNNGEPGAGMQILIRGGSSISNTNEPLYVIDGVAINNVATEPDGMGAGGAPPLPRNPLNMLNPADIASITVLKDASATAIYGSRAANGVVLIETKHGTTAGSSSIEYEGYVAAASPLKHYDALNGSEYRAFVQGQVSQFVADTAACAKPVTPTCLSNAPGLDPIHLTRLGTANTDWDAAVTRTSVTHNHNLTFSGGSEDTRYRASLNYMNQPGVTIANSLERIQGLLSANHRAFDNRLRLALTVTTSRENDRYITYENTGGFEGGVFMNVAIFNPTQPVTVTDSTGTHYYETGSTSVRNPVALANQVSNLGNATRTLGNASAEFDLVSGLTAKVAVGLDHSDGIRQIYFPNANPVGVALGGGLAQQAELGNTTKTLQTLLTFNRQSGVHSFDVVGGYEYTKFASNLVGAQGVGFFTDAFGFNNLSVASAKTNWSDAEDWRLVSFLSRANYGYKDRYFVTGILRYDGSSKFATGHQWALFPGLSASWHLSEEDFARSLPFSDLRLRVGWGRQGNPGIPPYQSLIVFQGGSGGSYPWGDNPQSGVYPSLNGNPNLKWEQTDQYNVGLDFGLWGNRLAGTAEYYVKNTSDLLEQVGAPQPAQSSTTLQNVGKLRNHGVELSLDALAASRSNLTWRAGITFAAQRNKVVTLGPFSFLRSGRVSGQGQSDQWAERLIPGQPLGTFYGPVFLGVDAAGHQVFACSAATSGCTNGRTTNGLGPASADYAIIGNANPSFTFGFHNQISVGKFDISALIRGSVGQDVFNNTALVYSTKSNALQDKNFLRPALTDPTGLHEPAIFSSRWIESATFVRLQNLTVDYTLDVPALTRNARSAHLFVSVDNLFVLTGYSGLDPEVSNLNQASLSPDAGIAARGVDYLSYPRPRTVTGGLRLVF